MSDVTPSATPKAPRKSRAKKAETIAEAVTESSAPKAPRKSRAKKVTAEPVVAALPAVADPAPAEAVAESVAEPAALAEPAHAAVVVPAETAAVAQTTETAETAETAEMAEMAEMADASQAAPEEAPFAAHAASSPERRAPESAAVPLEERIRLAAYLRYEARGCTDGLSLQDWIEAEREVVGAHA